MGSVMDQERPWEAKKRKAKHFDTLRKLVGYVADGSNETLKIWQDDATGSWVLRAGKVRWYGPSLDDVIDQAASHLRTRSK